MSNKFSCDMRTNRLYLSVGGLIPLTAYRVIDKDSVDGFKLRRPRRGYADCMLRVVCICRAVRYNSNIYSCITGEASESLTHSSRAIGVPKGDCNLKELFVSQCTFTGPLSLVSRGCFGILFRFS